MVQKKLLMERKLCELDPNCPKFYSQYFKFFCVKVKNFKDIGGKIWKWQLIKNCLSRNPISWIREFCAFCSAWKSVAHSKYQVSTCVTDNCVKIFRQDWAPSHSSRITQDHLQECTPIFVKKREWLPMSLDCNPKLRKSHIWRRRQRQGRKVHCAGTERCYCIGLWERITLEQIRSCLSSWEKCLRLVYQANGGHIEHLL